MPSRPPLTSSPGHRPVAEIPSLEPKPYPHHRPPPPQNHPLMRQQHQTQPLVALARDTTSAATSSDSTCYPGSQAHSATRLPRHPPRQLFSPPRAPPPSGSFSFVELVDLGIHLHFVRYFCHFRAEKQRGKKDGEGTVRHNPRSFPLVEERTPNPNPNPTWVPPTTSTSPSCGAGKLEG